MKFEYFSLEVKWVNKYGQQFGGVSGFQKREDAEKELANVKEKLGDSLIKAELEEGILTLGNPDLFKTAISNGWIQKQ